MHAVTLLLILACVDLMHLEVVLPLIPFTLRITFSCFSQISLRVRVGFHLCPRSISSAPINRASFQSRKWLQANACSAGCGLTAWGSQLKRKGRRTSQPLHAHLLSIFMQLTHAQGQICPENSNYCLPWYAGGQLCAEYKICDGKAL